MGSQSKLLSSFALVLVFAACDGGDDTHDRDPGTNPAAGDPGGAAASHGGDAAAARGGMGGDTAGVGAGGMGRGASGAGATATGGRAGAGRGGAGGMAGSMSEAGAAGVPAAGGGLRIEGKRILGPDGKPFHGRGANLSDTRSCDACSYAPPNVAGLNRWADELIDNWKANFIRFTLTAFAESGGRVQWKSVTADPQYLADIKATVTHMTSKPGVYVMVTVFLDPSMKPDNREPDSEWPTAQTLPVYEALAEAFYDNPRVLFGLTNEPHGPADRNPELAQRYLDSIDAIRSVEKRHNVAEHVIAVQAPQQWARYLEYFIDNPIDRTNVAYEIHAYNPQADFERLLRTPSQTLPIFIGEYGPSDSSTNADIMAMWAVCKELELPHIAWTFHMRCPPNLLQNSASDGCGLAAATGYDFPRTPWGDMFYNYMQLPW